jgi:hypothetical protein
LCDCQAGQKSCGQNEGSKAKNSEARLLYCMQGVNHEISLYTCQIKFV